MKKLIGSLAVKVVFMLILVLSAVVGFQIIMGNRTSFFNDTTETTTVSGTVIVETFDFSDVVLGEARGKSEFIVLEQDVEIETKTSRSLANISFFTKTQTMRTYGTGAYSVDLSKIQDTDIVVDNEKQTVLINIPRATLFSVTPDYDNTQFGDIERRSFLAFGDIEMTQQEQIDIQAVILDAMFEELETTSQFEKADQFAKTKVLELFEPVVKAVSSDFTVRIGFSA